MKDQEVFRQRVGGLMFWVKKHPHKVPPVKLQIVEGDQRVPTAGEGGTVVRGWGMECRTAIRF